MKYLSLALISMTLMQPLPAPADLMAGTVIFSSGNNTATSAAGERRGLKQGDTVRPGDRLQTDGGQLQVRFTDSGFVSLKPGSQMVINEYVFNGREDGTEKAFFSLVKGSLRAVTGVIGKHNKKAYKYETPVATIGIRGTAFVLSFCNQDCFDAAGSPLPDGLYVNNGEGRIYVENNEGVIDLVRGQFAFVKDIESQPRQIMQPPAMQELFIEEAEDYDFDHRPTENAVEEIRQGTIGLAFATFGMNDGAIFGASSGFFGYGGWFQADETGALTGFSFNRSSGSRISFDSGPAGLISSGVDPGQGLSWGVWDAGYLLDNYVEPVSYLHYIASTNLTPAGSLPGSGSIRYSGSTGDGSVLGTLGQRSSGEFVTDFSIVLDIDFATGDLTGLQMEGRFANGDSYTAGHASPAQLSRSLLLYNLTGVFSSADGDEAFLTGRTNFSFIGDGAEGVMGSYGLYAPSLPDVAIVGTYSAGRTGTFAPLEIETLSFTMVGGDLGVQASTPAISGPGLEITTARPDPYYDNPFRNDAIVRFEFNDPDSGDRVGFSSNGSEQSGFSGNTTVHGASWGIWEFDFLYSNGASQENNPQYLAYMAFADPTEQLPTRGTTEFNVKLGSDANGAIELLSDDRLRSDSFTANIGVDWANGNFTNFDLAAAFTNGSNFDMRMVGTNQPINGSGVPLTGTFDESSASGGANFQFANDASTIGGTFHVAVDSGTAALGVFLLGEEGLSPRR